MRVERFEDGQFFRGLMAEPVPPVFRVVGDVVNVKVIAWSALGCGDEVFFLNREIIAECKRIILEWISQHSPGTSGGCVRSHLSATERWWNMEIPDLLDYPNARLSIAVLLHHVWTQVLFNC